MRRIRPPRAELDPDVAQPISLLWRYKWSILATTLVALSVALFVSGRQTAVYESRARILVMPVETVAAGDLIVERPNIATERELVSSAAVADLVAEGFGGPEDRERLLEGLHVEELSGTEILEVRYRDTDPGRAQERAQAFAESYLEYRLGTVTTQLAISAADLDRQIDDLERRFRAIQRQLRRLPASGPQVTVLRDEATIIQNQLLQRQLARLGLASSSLTPGEIVEPAILPASPVIPNHVFNAGLGLAAGLALAVLLAFLRDRLSQRLRSASEVEECLGAPVLGTIPRHGVWRRRKRALLLHHDQWRSPVAESYRSLRTSLLSAATSTGTKCIVVTSPNANEATSAAVANLAVACARIGKRVLIISADLRKPYLHELFGVNGGPGLIDVLKGRAQLRSTLRKVELATTSWGSPSLRLWILPSGQVSEGDLELLSSETMQDLVEKLGQASDIVFIHAQPVLPVTDGLVVAPSAATLLVLGPKGVSRPLVVSARQRLDRAGAQILGAVLSGSDTNVRA